MPFQQLQVWSLIILSTLVFYASSAQIRLNTLGFFPDQPKRASIAATCTNFSVIRVGRGEVVFKGTVNQSQSNQDTGETIYVADFSECKEIGTFELDVRGVGRSAPFQIRSNVYDNAFYLVTRGFYLWRCGTAVSTTNNGKIFAHEACHTNDAWLDFATGQHAVTNSTKGWHDAGDYNKYVVNAGVTVGVLFRAWEDFGDKIKKTRLDLPEAGGNLPEFLAELKWELDWLLTMQAPDGSVYHKVSTERFGPFVTPEKEQTQRYFSPWSSAATADFVAVMAMAARDFRPYEPAYADECLHAAEKSYAFLVTHPEEHLADLSHFTTGPYQIRDADVRIWAAAELWETTGQTNYLHDFEKRINQVERPLDLRWDYGNVKNLGTITYLFSKRDGRNASTVEMLRSKLTNAANIMVKTAATHGYARPFGTSYSWGCNGSVARQVLILQAANRLAPNPDYTRTSLDSLGYLFGRNFHGRSYVTGLGFNPPQHPHDRRTDAVNGAWPGYLVGGPNLNAKDWRDEQGDYRVNEIAINWNSALVYALAAFLN